MRHVRRLLVATLMTMTFVQQLIAATPVKLDDAIATLAALESQVGVVKYRVAIRYVDSRNQDETRCDAEVLFDFATRKYRIARTQILEWVGNKIGATHNSKRSATAFDGKIHRSWSQSRPGKQIPELGQRPIEGAIDVEKEPGEATEVMIRSTGLVHCFPFVEIMAPTILPLSTMLKGVREAKLSANIQDNEDGTWQITFAEPLSDSQRKYRLVVNISSGGLWENIECEIHGQPLFSGTAELQKTGSGSWFPKTIQWKASPYVQRFEFSDCEVNPKVSDRDYSIDFPVGTQVDDRIGRKFYIVSGGPIDETKAIGDFMARHGLRPEEARTGSSYTVILGYAVAAAVIISFGIWFRRARTLLILAAALIPAAATADDSVNSTSFPFRNPSDTRNIRQCSFTASVFALKWYGAEFDPKVLMDALSPTNSGVKLLAVKHVLEAHGLIVEEREKVTDRDVSTKLPRDCIAIVTVAGKTKVKHLVIACWQRGQVLCVDPPAGVMPFEQAYQEDALKAGGSIALLVRQRTERSISATRQDNFVEFVPGKLEFGEMLVSSNSEPIKKHMTIRNVGRSPLLLVSVESSCGCTAVHTDGGLLHEREEKTIDVTVRPSAWGLGRIERQVKLKFANGLKTQFAITGTGTSAETLQRLTVSSLHCPIEVTRGEIASGRSRTIELLVTHELHADEVLNLKPTAQWLKCEQTRVNDKRTKLTLQAEFDKVSRDLLRSQPDGVRCELLLSTEDDLEPVRVIVELKRKSFVTVKPRVTRLHRTMHHSDEIVVSLNDDGPPLQLKSASARSEDLQVKLDSQTKAELRFLVQASESASQAVHVVTLKLASGNDETDATFVVQMVSDERDSETQHERSSQ